MYKTKIGGNWLTTSDHINTRIQAKLQSKIIVFFWFFLLCFNWAFLEVEGVINSSSKPT